MLLNTGHTREHSPSQNVFGHLGRNIFEGVSDFAEYRWDQAYQDKISNNLSRMRVGEAPRFVQRDEKGGC